MKLLSLLAAVLFASASGASAAPKIVEFHIPAGTGEGAWNTQDNPVTANVGDTIRIINDDTIPHYLHTNYDKPCKHGSKSFKQGESYDCVVINALDVGSVPNCYDHQFGADAAFWVKATKQFDDDLDSDND